MSIRGLTKAYPGTLALDSVDLDVIPGTIHALVGANGSGKSTLVKILAGVESPGAAGKIVVAGSTVAAGDMSPAAARHLGIAFVHQDIGVFDDLSIAENIGLASGLLAHPVRPIAWRRLHQQADELLDRYGIDADSHDLVGSLSPATKTMLAIARALGMNGAQSSLLVLDEPTASLPSEEVSLLVDMLKGCASRGQAILFISHHLSEILGLADRITVLRDGKVVANLRAEEVTESELANHIAGRAIERMFPTGNGTPAGPVALEVSGLSAGGIEDIDLKVHRGEIVGVAGLLGSGRTTLLRTIFGEQAARAGVIKLDGTSVRISNAKEAMRLGVAYVPEDRQKDAAFMSLSVRENHTVASLRSFWRRGRMRHAHEHADTHAFIDRFRVKTSGSDVPLRSLSGGNQQKIVLSRWLRRQPSLLLLDEPSQGVDVGSRADIYGAIRSAADHGMAVLVVASDFEELSHACDRVVVLRNGRIVAEFDPPPTPDDLINAACGLLREGTP